MIPFEYIEKKLDASNYTPEEKQEVLNRLVIMEDTWNDNVDEFYKLELDNIIRTLLDNQLDPITHGRGYQQTDILNHLKKLR